ncbi:MAG: YbfB/YjiJ family MFS transporter [Hyphomicrobiaceae bacterium]
MATAPSPLRTALTGFLILVFSMGIGRFAFTPILPMMQSEGLLSVGDGGVLASVHFIGYAMGAVLSWRLTWSPRSVLVLSLAAIALSTIAMGLTNAYGIWLAARWVAGVCSALVLVAVSTQFVKVLAQSGRLELEGVVFAGVGGGTALVGLMTLWLMAVNAPSRIGWLVFGFATLAVTVAVYVLIANQTFVGPTDSDERTRSAPRLVWQVILPYGAMGAGYIIPATYLPIMAQQAIASPMVFGWSWPIFGGAAAMSTVVAARLYGTFSNRQIWIASQLVMGLGLLIPALSSHIVAIIVGGLCVGGTFMVVTMAGLKEAHNIGGTSGAQHHIAAMTVAFALGQIIGPALAGWAYDATQSFAYPLLIGGFVLIATLVPMLKQSVAIAQRPQSPRL